MWFGEKRILESSEQMKRAKFERIIAFPRFKHDVSARKSIFFKFFQEKDTEPRQIDCS